MQNHKAISFGDRKSKLLKRLSRLLCLGNFSRLFSSTGRQALVLYFMISIEEAEMLLKKENISLNRKELEALLNFFYFLAKIEYDQLAKELILIKAPSVQFSSNTI